MSEPLNTVSNTNTGSQNDLKPNYEFVRSHVGILLIVNMILLFFAWVIMSGWKDNLYFWPLSFSPGVSFFLVTTVIPWLTLIFQFLVSLLKLRTKYQINWPLTRLINCVVWVILLTISSSIILSHAVPNSNNALIAAAAFGFFSVLGMAIQGFLHFKELRNPV